MRGGRIVTVAALALACTSAHATTLCANRAGKVSVREGCRRRETAVAPADVGLVGPKGDQGPAGAPGPAGMVPYRLIDAAGRPLGTVASYDSFHVQTVLEIPGVDVPLQFKIVEGQFFLEFGIEDAVYYADAACSGTPLITEGGSIVPLARIVGTRGYFSKVPEALQEVTSQEFVASDCGMATPTGRGTCCRSLSSMRYVSPGETFDPAVLGATPPFTLVPR
jgi:hypothetical protein